MREALTVVPAGLRLRVIAIDGFDPRIFEELATSGRLPALTATVLGTRARLEPREGDAGDPGARVDDHRHRQPPDVHGVQGLETRRVAGMQGTRGDRRASRRSAARFGRRPISCA